MVSMKTARGKRKRKAARRPPRYESLRDLLVSRRQELLAHMQDGLEESRAGGPGARFVDPADLASDALYDELAQGFAEIASADLRMIERALRKIDDGSYGLCEACGRRIPLARLRLVPFAELCVECKREEEEGEGPGSPPMAPPTSVTRG